MSDVDLARRIELVPLDQLRPHPQNYRSHPDDQVAHLEQSLRDHGAYRPVIVARDGTMLVGHGLYKTAVRMGIAELPVLRLDLDPAEPAALKLLVGDNELGKLAEVDDQLLAEHLRALAELDDLLGTGYDATSLDAFSAALLEPMLPLDPVDYSMKVESPVYEPVGEPPPVATLAGTEKLDELRAAIEAAEIPDDVRSFLRLAAHRHIRFDYESIANYYAHAPAEIQRLMEQSALVIIDFEQAIERGFVRLHQEIGETFGDDYPDA